ncbi:hypothetical protein IV203_029618 [Nitzschia inconspicua]|uniref:Uncharacterized protein n=1 Tax=Nitzschia inconspicua TaxID=303405 RepID=A0A9K3LS41_9STRA|nr:hypothetical protein IV203_029618 [Nitzschia inconspicua]
MWDHCYKEWLNRNKARNGKDADDKAQRQLEKAHLSIRALYDLKPKCSLQAQRHYFDPTVEDHFCLDTDDLTSPQPDTDVDITATFSVSKFICKLSRSSVCLTKCNPSFAMTTMSTNLTASQVDAFDDWFSNLDDEDDFATSNFVVAPEKTAVSVNDFDDGDESWLDSSDDEDAKKRKNKKNKAKEGKTLHQGGDLEKLFQTASSTNCKVPDETRNSPGMAHGRKTENKALALLRKEDEKKARKIVEERIAMRKSSVERRRSISNSIDKELSFNSASNGENNDFDREKTVTCTESRARRAKRSPHRGQRDTIRPAVQLSQLYWDGVQDESAPEKGLTPNDEQPEVEGRAAVTSKKIPKLRSTSQGRRRPRSRDPLSRSSHDADIRTANTDPSSRRRDPLSMSAHQPRERRAGDPLSRSSHGRPKLMTRQSSYANLQSNELHAMGSGDSLSRSYHGRPTITTRQNSFSNPLSRGSRLADSSRRRCQRDPLSISDHPAIGSETNRREHRCRREDPLSRSNHGIPRARHSSTSPKPHFPRRQRFQANGRKRGDALSASVHRSPCRSSSQNDHRRSRSPSGLAKDPMRRLARDIIKESNTKVGITADGKRLPRTRSDPALNQAAGEKLTKTEEEMLLLLAIGDVKSKQKCRSLAGLRERQSPREGSSIFDSTRRRRSKSPKGL